MGNSKKSDMRDWATSLERHLSAYRRSGFEIKGPGIKPPKPPRSSDLPDELRRFYATACSSAQVTFYKEFPQNALPLDDGAFCGCIKIVSEAKQKRVKQELIETVRNTWLAADAVQRELWLAATPFLELKNGDYIGIGKGERIWYLSHDEESFLLAKSLADWLDYWRSVFFIGPEWWVLDPVLTRSGLVTRARRKVVAFRRSVAKLLPIGKLT